ncbi:MAG TPA: amino acid permease [Chitinophagaceae bacterium]|nr:amino acid permease [Chitinophagaceae bacterium]
MEEITEKQNTTVEQSQISLNRVVGVFTAILMVSGNMIGTGVFKKLVPMSQTGMSEGSILLAWVVAGIIVILGAFTFAGLSKLTTESGGAYEYLRVSFGGFPAFLMGWGLFMIMGSGSVAAVAYVFSQSVNSLIAIPDPLNQWSHISIANYIYPFDSSGIKIFAVITVVILSWFNYRGIKNSAMLNNIVTGAKILGILFLILGGLILAVPSHTSTAVVQTATDSTSSALMVFMAAMLSAFWAYDGFTNVTAIAGEIKDPKRNIPIAIITAVTSVMVLYVLLNYAFMRVMSLNELVGLGENQIVATEVAGKLTGNAGATAISLLIMLSSFGTLNIIILFYSRVYFRMAQEGAFFKSAAKIHPQYRTPYNALWYSMIWSCILILTGTFDILTNLVIFTGFAFYILQSFGLIKLKRKKVITEKVSGYPVAPVLFIIFTGIFLTGVFIDNPVQSLIGIGLLMTGVPFYFYFKKKYS